MSGRSGATTGFDTEFPDGGREQAYAPGKNERSDEGHERDLPGEGDQERREDGDGTTVDHEARQRW